jgi:hypothetical protein
MDSFAWALKQKDLGKTALFLYLALWPRSFVFWQRLHRWQYPTSQ